MIYTRCCYSRPMLFSGPCVFVVLRELLRNVALNWCQTPFQTKDQYKCDSDDEHLKGTLKRMREKRGGAAMKCNTTMVKDTCSEIQTSRH